MRSALRRIVFLAAYDLKFMLRHRETLLWVFFMPAIFMFLVGSMSGGGPRTARRPVFGVADRDGSPVSRDVLRHLDSLGFEVRAIDATAHPDSAALRFRRSLSLPEGLGERAIAGEEQSIAMIRTGESGEDGRLDEVRAQRAVLRTIGDLALAASARQARGDSSLDLAEFSEELEAIRRRPPAIEILAETAGRSRLAPRGFQQSVPGTIVQFVMMVLLTTGGTFLVMEREAGLLRRLASSAYTKSELVAAKMLARLGTAFVQMLFAMLVGTVAFRVDWGSSGVGLFAVLLSFALSTSALSVLFGNLARSRGQSVGFGVLGGNVLAALGGCWWPIEIASPSLQKVSWLIPTGWTMHGLHRLMSFGDPASAVLPMVLALLGSALLFGFLAAKTFRYQ